ncbi:pyruvate kinase [Natronomonas amylolytica]|uniref:pyruvate kinase n=1 Tax=Natronomonas amylolytica TaxID=3108498 RepID=UPI00300A122C
MRNAKIVCTLGPASADRDTVRKLADAGMAVARLNASHGTTEGRAETIERVREVDAATDDSLGVMVDLQGPEVRTAETDDAVELRAGREIRFTEGDVLSDETVGLSDSIAAVEPGDTVLLDDGRIETTVERVEGDDVIAVVDSGGRLGGRKGVTIRGVDLGLDLVGEADEREIRMAADHEADFVAASFVRDGDDVYEIADALDAAGGGGTPVVAKIERAVAVENLDGIVAAADGVMVARGDLGVECPLEDVPLIQKRIINRCMAAGVPVITATEMLDSMVHAKRPTRAEASDVANAVLDGTDAVMLSGETAIGDNPVAAAETMARIIRRIEESDEYAETRDRRVPAADDSRTDALARSARYLARDVDASAIVAVSESGYTARKVAKFRPTVPVVATTPDDRVRRQLTVSWGIDAHVATYEPDIEDVLDTAVDVALASGLAESGDTIVVLSGMLTDLPGTDTTNTLKVHVVAETIARGTSAVAGQVAGPLVRPTGGDLSALPEGSILALPEGFDAEFEGDLTGVGGIITAATELTGYQAIIARELGVPMVADATLPADIPDGTVVTIDADRGVVYEGDVTRHDTDR